MPPNGCVRVYTGVQYTHTHRTHGWMGSRAICLDCCRCWANQLIIVNRLCGVIECPTNETHTHALHTHTDPSVEHKWAEYTHKYFDMIGLAALIDVHSNVNTYIYNDLPRALIDFCGSDHADNECCSFGPFIWADRLLFDHEIRSFDNVECIQLIHVRHAMRIIDWNGMILFPVMCGLCILCRLFGFNKFVFDFILMWMNARSVHRSSHYIVANLSCTCFVRF